MSQSRSIKKIVQLITQTNNCALMPRLLIQASLSLSFSLAPDLTKNTNIFQRPKIKNIFLLKSFLIDSFRGSRDKRIIQYIQKINISLVAKNGLSQKWEPLAPKKLYLKFINTKSIDGLEKFIRKNGFSVFPNLQETKNLLAKYKKKKIRKSLAFLEARGVNIESRKIEKMNKEQEEIFRINLEFIWGKKLELETLVKKYEKGALEYHELQKINHQLENVSDILINNNHQLLKELARGIKGSSRKDKRSLEKIIGMKKIKDIELIPAYRIYGHYALCYLEFYLDILRNNKIMVCNNCSQYNKIEKGKHFDREFCTREESEKCFLKIQSERKQKSRTKK